MPNVFQPLNWTLSVSVPPIAEPVTIPEAAAELNLSSDDDLARLDLILIEAREHVEMVTNRALLSQTRDLRLRCFPLGATDVIELLGGNCSAITEISYLDESNQTVVWDAANYELISGDQTGNCYVALAVGVSEWPATSGRWLPVSISYVAGWQTTDEVPAVLRGCVRRVAASLFESTGADQKKGMEQSVWYKSMVSNWRISRVYS